MDFFNNQNDNSKTNEDLLDQVMAQHKKREEKHNIKKGYLLSKNVGPVSNPYEKEKVNNATLKNATPSQFAQNEPMYVVGGKKFSNRPKVESSAKGKMVRLAIIFAVLAVLITAAALAVFFLDVHKIKFVCGNMEGITIYNEKREELEELSLRLNESTKFKVVLDSKYSNSDIEVMYNNVEIKPDIDGYYTIKYTGESDEIRIIGVMENQYTITTRAYDGLKFYTKDSNGAWSKDITNQDIKSVYNDKIQFKVYDTIKQQYILPPYSCVYMDDMLITAVEDVYEVVYTKDCKISAYNSSPFDCFNISAVYDSNNPNSITGYNLTGVSVKGQELPVLALPTVYNGLPVTYKFSYHNYYPQIKELIIDARYIKNYTMFEQFNDLEKITVKESEDSGLYSQDGILYNKENGTNKVQLIKCPSGYGKELSEGERILSINPDEICTGAFARLNYIKTISMGNKVAKINPLAFRSEGYQSESYSFVFVDNTSFKVENNIIYSYDGTTIISAQFATGEFHVPNGMVVAPNAFTYSSITKLVFDGNATIMNQGVAMILSLTEIVYPKNTESIAINEMLGNAKVKIIDLDNTVGVVAIEELAFIEWTGVEQIIVPHDLYDDYLVEYANATFVDLFVQGEDDNVIHT